MGQIPCRSSTTECVSNDNICDGSFDCGDRSDELFCGEIWLKGVNDTFLMTTRIVGVY